MAAPTTFFYVYTPCCGADPIYFKPGGPGIVPGTYDKVFIYEGAIDGPGYGGLYIGQCYGVTIAELGTLPSPAPQNSTEYSFLNIVPSQGYSNLFPINVNSPSCVGLECPTCPQVCYLLVSCDFITVPFTTTTDLSAYVGQSIQVSASDIGTVCVQVLIAPVEVTCNNSIPVVYVGTCVCDCICYSVVASAKNCLYVKCDGTLGWTGLLTGLEVKICSKSYPYLQGIVMQDPFYIIDNGLCVDGLCPDLCFKLVDCDGIEDPIYTTSQSLGIYAILNTTIHIEGSKTCWLISEELVCNCSINVVVTQTFVDCASCKEPVSYQLTECTTGEIVYTTSNLSLYVNQVVERTGCAGCWLVEQLNFIPPSDIIITVTLSYKDCKTCNTNFYQLTDCNGVEQSIITYTDLSAYVAQVITLDWCPSICWRVSTTNEWLNAGVVFVNQNFTTCVSCLTSFPCICSTVTNHGTTTEVYEYTNCSANIETYTLAPGETSPKTCLIKWNTTFATDTVTYFGDCTYFSDAYDCPAPIYPKRYVTPGYNTPACSIEKYEKISCRAAEVMYKKVLEQRYGITNCCPDDDQKWLIKKQLIDLAALLDPDYICAITTSCCNEAPNCGCSPLKTCNS